MGGILSHLAIGIGSGSLVYHIWRKKEFFFATLVGNTIVDFFKFFFAAVQQQTWKLFSVDHDATFWLFADLTNSYFMWFALGFFALTLVAFLYHHHVIRKKTLLEYDELVWAFLFGVILHLLFDAFYAERFFWL